MGNFVLRTFEKVGMSLSGSWYTNFRSDGRPRPFFLAPFCHSIRPSPIVDSTPHATPSVQLYHAGYIPIPFQHRRPWHLVECNCCSSRSFTANCFGGVVDVRVGSFLAAVSCINGHPTPAKAIGHDGRCNCCNIAMAAKAAESLQLLQRCDDPGCCCVVTLPANC